jgi:hypothetical protein
MACGTPVIVSNTTSLPEVVGDAGVLVNPSRVEEIAHAMHRVATDQALRTALREKGLARARQFSWETTARLTLAAYEEAWRRWRRNGRRRRSPSAKTNVQTFMHDWMWERSVEHAAAGAREDWIGVWP